MPGKIRVSNLARELGIKSRDAVELLNQLGEHVKTASSTVEAPAARKLRERCANGDIVKTAVEPRPVRRHVSRAAYPRNNPYMDLGRTEVDHRQIADGRPARPPHDPFLASRPRRAPRGVYKGDISDLDLIMLRVMLRDRPLRTAPKGDLNRYWADEVEDARRWSTSWANALVSLQLDFEEVEDWALVLGVMPDMGGHEPGQVAAQLKTAGVEPQEMRSWRYEDGKHKNLAFRLMIGNITIDEAINYVLERRKPTG